MPVKVYVQRDQQGQPWPPDHSHETSAVISLVQKLWQAFHHQPVLYTIVANLHKPSADLIIITEHGLGVVELKDYPGHILGQGNSWYSQIDGKRVPIKAGSVHNSYRNPHEQVQAYADEIRNLLLNPPPRQDPWLPGRSFDWQGYKLSTTVCFTHSGVDIETLKNDVQQRKGVHFKPWEDFSVILLPEITRWAASLRFEVNQGPRSNFIPYRLSKKQITNIVSRLLKATEWSEILELMPTGEPYGYLTLIDQDISTILFGLDRDEVLLGRENTCEVVIPDRFSRVSRQHAKITRNLEGIFIEDLGSRNGVYVNGAKIQQQRLLPGQYISLGGPEGTGKVSLLKFSTQVADSDSTEARTEITK